MNLWRTILAGAMTWIVAIGLAQAAQPNMVLFIADDMDWQDCGPYGNDAVRTPNLDRLAREGMCFDQAVLTISSCSPSRASLITGRYPHNTDAEELHWPLPGDQITFVEKLRAGGYWTAAAGKWHMGDAVRDRFDFIAEADVSGFQLPTGKAAEAGRFIERSVGDARSGCDQWLNVLRRRPEGKPFFLWLAALDPHRPYDEGILSEPHSPDDVVVAPFLPDRPETRKDLALYYDEITRLDRFVGEILEELDREGLADNTFVLFISDNGRPFPRCKTTLYDSGIRTPWIVRWPGHIDPGTRCGRLVSAVDIAPAFLELAGIERPPTFQGVSFLPLLKDPGSPTRTHAFAEKNWHDFEDHARAVRSERFKYIRNYYPDLPNTPPADAVRSPTYEVMLQMRAAGELSRDQRGCFTRPRAPEELYDLESDPHELRNLAGNQRYLGTLRTMRQALAQWEYATGDSLPATRTPDEFDREFGKPLPVRKRPRPSKAEMFPDR